MIIHLYVQFDQDNNFAMSDIHNKCHNYGIKYNTIVNYATGVGLRPIKLAIWTRSEQAQNNLFDETSYVLLRYPCFQNVQKVVSWKLLVDSLYLKGINQLLFSICEFLSRNSFPIIFENPGKILNSRLHDQFW